MHIRFARALSVVSVVSLLSVAAIGGQAVITPPSNKYTAAEDVALGQAQASKATKYEIGTLLGAVVGSIIGGEVGGAVAQGTQFGLATAFLRFSRDFERQADLLGSHIVADAGYDPRDMASMFKTIEQQGGSGGPAWLSSHPDPGDRYAAITREAALLKVRHPARDERAFTQAQARLRQMAPAPTTEAASDHQETTP